MNSMRRSIGFIAVVLTLVCSSCEEHFIHDPETIGRMIRHLNLGLAYLEENRLSDAESEFLKLVEIAPEEALGYADLGLAYLRMGRYADAEEQLKRALDREPDNPDILLILADVYVLTNRGKDALRQLERSLVDNPRHSKSLYKIAQLYARFSDDESRWGKMKEYLGKFVDYMPGNIAVRLQLIEVLVRTGNADGAVAHLEEIRRQVPDLPEEATEFYDQSFSLLKAATPRKALGPILAVLNLLKPLPLYQAGIYAVRGPAETSVGFPITIFSERISRQMQRRETVVTAVRFTDVTTSVGLDVPRTVEGDMVSAPKLGSNIALGDFDGDDDPDVYVARWDPARTAGGNLLFRNDNGKFVEVSSEAGVKYAGKSVSAIFADYNNDGYQDLYVVNAGSNVLYENTRGKGFSNVTMTATVADPGISNAALFFDGDHDGDLDLYVANSAINRLYRNNRNGTFSELGEKIGVSGGNVPSVDAAFGDFDEDGDIDLFVVNENSSNLVFTNLRQGYFEDITAHSGLTTSGGSGAVAVGDYNNDGFLDLFVTALSGGQYHLYQNNGDGTYRRDTESTELSLAVEGSIGLDSHFLDFDNDGFLDLLVVGTGSEHGEMSRGIFLFRNDGTGRFQDVSTVLPENISSGQGSAIADYDGDGDVDIFVTDGDGMIHLLRNDGGNANRWLKLQLLGLSTESGKNNRNGIGAKLEVKAGDLYQMRVVSDPVSYFGLGYHSEADVVRIVWTNGVAQNILHPSSDQAIVEEQVLKGSCPSLYAWDGKKYEFVKDVLWRSALGMPLGIMGSSVTYAFPYSTKEYVKIPGPRLRPRNGTYSLQITEDLWETAYLDEVKLIVIDHPDSGDVYVDERFIAQPVPPFHIYTVVQKRTPESATDEHGSELLPFIREQDDIYVSNLRPTKYQGITEMHDLILDLRNRSRTGEIVLFLRGWIFPTDASINLSISQSPDVKMVPPYLQVVDEQGNWKTVIENVGFPNGKNKIVVANLSGKFLSEDCRVRIRTNMQIYWDHIFFSAGESRIPLRETTLRPGNADVHYRGFSRMYRKSYSGPFWFDYSTVTKRQLWRDLEGYYTRYGDVTSLVQEADDKYVIMNAGDEITVEFDATAVPELNPGWSRDYLLYTDGWLKDGDLNTAFSQTVEPLPFHGMSRYPYGDDESYPLDKEHQDYLAKYNTRKVTPEEFRTMLSRR